MAKSNSGFESLLWIGGGIAVFLFLKARAISDRPNPNTAAVKPTTIPANTTQQPTASGVGQSIAVGEIYTSGPLDVTNS